MVSLIKNYPKTSFSISAVLILVGAGITYMIRTRPYVPDDTDEAGA